MSPNKSRYDLIYFTILPIDIFYLISLHPITMATILPKKYDYYISLKFIDNSIHTSLDVYMTLVGQ